MDASSLCGRPGPLVLEIGFGDGRFLAVLARNHPDWNLVGVEVSLASVSRAWRRMRREGHDDVRLFKGNARFLVRDVLRPGSLHRVYVNFPDPWPRKRHLVNRLLQSEFFELLSTRLEPGGSVLLTTDHEEYFDFACEQAEATGLFDAAIREPPEGTLDTKYALKWQAEARNIQHVSWSLVRRGPPFPPKIEFTPMQHALLDGDLATVRSFAKQIRRFAGGTAVVTEAFRTMEEDGLLFTVVVQETDLRQELLVRAFHKDSGVYVGLQAFGDAIGTRGAGEAVWAVVDGLVAQGFTVIKTWI